MKKFRSIILIMILSIFLFTPKEAFAMTWTDMHLSHLRYGNQSSTIVDTREGFKLFTIDNNQFVGFTDTTNRLTWINYHFTMDNIQLGRRYDFTFFLHQNNVRAGQGEPPVVTFDNKACYVTPYGMYNSGTTGYPNTVPTPDSNGLLPYLYEMDFTKSYDYVVTCYNLDIYADNDINVYTATGGNLDSGGYYGLGTRLYYEVSNEEVASQNQNDLISNIQKQTEETKKQTEEIKKGNETAKETQDYLKDKDTTESEENLGGFFDNFNDNDYGLSDIITMPLSFIRSLSSSTCNSLRVPLPLVDQEVVLPCMTSIYQNYFGSFLTIYQTITTGFIAYWVCINILSLIQNFKNPDSDRVEVMEL